MVWSGFREERERGVLHSLHGIMRDIEGIVRRPA
jgi:hypothetical protein